LTRAGLWALSPALTMCAPTSGGRGRDNPNARPPAIFGPEPWATVAGTQRCHFGSGEPSTSTWWLPARPKVRST
jgi:hypothetical protein